MNKIILTTIVVITAGVGYLILTKIQVPEMSPSPTVTPDGEPVAETYTSSFLGVEFQYDTNPAENVAIEVKESGDTIYLYMAGTAPESGQFLKMFAKNADETLEVSIRRQILKDFPSPDCKIEIRQSNAQDGYQIAEITYPPSDDPDEPWFENQDLCNGEYARTNGIRYFLYSPMRPDKFAFLSIGQYAILADDDTTWQDTLVFTR